MKALIVDDSTVMRKVLKGALARASIVDVDEAADGKEAVDLVSKNDAYSIVLMDWNMPNMSGIDAVRVIRADGFSAPIVMVTTEAEKSRVVEALKADANNYVIKPFETTGIVNKIRQALDVAA